MAAAVFTMSEVGPVNGGDIRPAERRRMNMVMVMLGLFGAVVVVRLAHVTMLREVKTSAVTRRHRFRRGEILDRNQVRLAFSVSGWSLFAEPDKISPGKAREYARRMAPHLPLSEKEVYRKLTAEKSYVFVRRQISDSAYRAIDADRMRGVYGFYDDVRVYPQKHIFSQVLGFVGVDNKGLEGIEYSLNKELADRGEETAGPSRAEGKTVILTVDAALQNIAYRYVKAACEKHGAKRGLFVLLKSDTAEVLAMGNYPAYDRSRYRTSRAARRRNLSVTDMFEPGSVMKPFTVAELFEKDRVHEREVFRAGGTVKVGPVTIRSTVKPQSLTFADILARSCNVGVINASRRLRDRELYEALRRAGFGKACGLRLPGEADGLLRHYRKWSGVSKAFISIGQEIAVTLLQLTAAYNSFVNDGSLLRPQIVRAVTDGADDPPSVKPRRANGGRVFSSRTSQRVRRLLEYTVEAGTAQNAQRQGLYVAGKTGTAQKASGGHYLKDRHTLVFCGFFGQHRPDYTLGLMIDEPKKGGYAGTVVAPVFADIASEVVRCRSGTVKQAVRGDPRGYLSGYDFNQYRGMKTVPDFTGMSIAKARIIMYINGGIVRVYGGGLVRRQRPSAGTTITKGMTVIVWAKPVNEQ